MGPKSLSTNSNLTSPKEAIRRKIRDAMTTKGTNRFPNIDLSQDFVPASSDIVRDFVIRFREKGGKYIPCTNSNITERLVKLIQGQQYSQLLCTKPQLAALLQKNGISSLNSIDSNTTVDAAVVFADSLIASTGSIVFTPNHSMYPSVKNLARDIIVISAANKIYPDIKYVFSQQQSINGDKLFAINEIITPTVPLLHNGEEHFTPLSPRFILLLLS